MDRPIDGFHQDAASHWVAELRCGHGQHVRHTPPFAERPWVLTAEGREAHLGVSLDCLRCDRSEMPDGWVPYQRTPEFDGGSIPAGLRAAHTTKRGVWALIEVSQGRLAYCVGAPYHRREVLTPDAPGVVLPEVEHHLEVLGPVVFSVQFWRAGEQTPPTPVPAKQET